MGLLRSVCECACVCVFMEVSVCVNVCPRNLEEQAVWPKFIIFVVAFLPDITVPPLFNKASNTLSAQMSRLVPGKRKNWLLLEISTRESIQLEQHPG